MNLSQIKTLSLIVVLASLQQLFHSCNSPVPFNKPLLTDTPGVAVLLVDTDHSMARVDKNIYGHFLEHINHSVIDGLYAEQVQGQGFEGKDAEVYWKRTEKNSVISVVDTPFQKGQKSVRLSVNNGTCGIRQDRFYCKKGEQYNGSVWINPEAGSLQLLLRIVDGNSSEIAKATLPYSGAGWQEVKFSFVPSITDTAGTLELLAEGSGSVLVDFISVMPAIARQNGKLRPDLLESLKGLNPPFMRWPGGSFASTYKWQDGIGPAVSRVYHPNVMWGGYADYYGFGTDEFLELCRQLKADPMITLPAPSTEPEAVEYAMNWVHYLVDPPTTAWGKIRSDNGHPQPYRIPYIQIDNEPMNNQQSADDYAAIVNIYGSRLRAISPNSSIIACGQKRSNDLNWSQKLVNMAGKNFDILGCHNYEYEPESFQTGVQRIADYLVKLDHFIRNSAHPAIKIAVLEWSLCRTYDWRAGLHTAGSLSAYERLSPSVPITCPALLMRNTTDNPEWRAFIYHDHVSWFPGSGYIVEKLFREHYAPIQLASTSGIFKDSSKHSLFFDEISQMKPGKWTPGIIDAIATTTEDRKQIVIKAVNYSGVANTLLVRLQGAAINEKATIQTIKVQAALHDAPSMEHPDAIRPIVGNVPFVKEPEFLMDPYSVLVVVIDLH